MKVSIITINLNDKSGLQRTMDSVFGQTFSDYEFIIIDGKSNDGSLELIETHQEKLVYWISEKDSGIYNAMNKGIKQAKGEYCYFLNAGDYLASKDVLSKVFETETDAGFICTNFTTENKSELKLYKPYKGKSWTFALYDIYSGDLCHQAFFIRTDNFLKYEYYDEKLRITSDWRLFFIAIGIHHETVEYRDVDMVVYNMGGLSSQIGGEAIYKERKQTAIELLPEAVSERLDRIYFLEQNSYITDNIRSNSVLFFLFRGYCKLRRILGLKV